MLFMATYLHHMMEYDTMCVVFKGKVYTMHLISERMT